VSWGRVSRKKKIPWGEGRARKKKRELQGKGPPKGEKKNERKIPVERLRRKNP